MADRIPDQAREVLLGLVDLVDALGDQWDTHRSLYGPLDHAEPCCGPCVALARLDRLDAPEGDDG